MFFVGFPAPLDAEESDSLCLLGRQPWRVWLKLLGLMASESDWYPLDTPRHCRWVFELKSLVYTSLTGFGWFRCSSMGIGSILTQLKVGLGDH